MNFLSMWQIVEFSPVIPFNLINVKSASDSNK